MTDHQPPDEAGPLPAEHTPSPVPDCRPGSPQVFIVGAGPGHSGLLTLRAVECLAQADVVIYDKLVPEALLNYASPRAERRCVTDLAVAHVDRYRPVLDLMINAAKQGKRVVRLKGGDPFVFGRGGEEVLALKRHGVAFEIVPGVTAAIGVAACAGIPLTHRDHASAVALVTGHENPDKPETAVDWAALAKFPGTLVIYMGLSRFHYISKALIRHGKDPHTPSAVIHHGTTGFQQTVEGTLADLAEKARHSGLTSPALIVIGSVVALRPQLNWFEKRPLFGQRVLLTRPRAQTAEMAHKLELLGAIPLILPAIEIRELSDWSLVDAALGNLADYDWLVFTSANGVRAFLNRLPAIGKDMRALGSLQIAAIGPKTAETLREFHLTADLIPAAFRSEDLVEALKPRVQGKKILLARADRGRDLLPTELSDVAQVSQLTVYSQTDAVDTHSPLLDDFRRGEINYVTLTSSNIAQAFLGSLDDICRRRIEAGATQLVSISPVTSAKIRALGFPVAAEARDYTTDGVIEALIDLHQTVLPGH
jgi:uroporphyrinogen III methyltransferase/synthase